MADGIFYRDLRTPFLIVDEPVVTLATTFKALWVPGPRILPANYWWVGKKVKLTAFGKATTDATAGNYTFGMGYGAGDNPAAMSGGLSPAGTVSRPADTWMAEGYAECRAVGAAGSLRLWGRWTPVSTLVASTSQPYLFPTTAPADLTIDTTAGTNTLTFQMSRSGAGVWTATTTGLIFEALN